MTRTHDNWATPPELLDMLNREFRFDHDPCPLGGTDGLDESKPWGKRNFVNPPYSKELKASFICRAVDEKEKGNTSVLLLPVCTDTKIFHNVILPNQDEIRFIEGRPAFWENGVKPVRKTTGRMPIMIVVFKGVK